MNKEKEEAERIIDMFLKVNELKDVSRATNPFISIGFAKQCALLHVEGIVEDNMTILVWLENIKAEDKVIHGIKRNIDFYNSVKYQIDKK